jgi:hypothetical protein
VLEGDFALAMPKGSVVTGYALDINGILVDGVLESRYKAQEAYQSRVAVRVDPGLAEVDYADRFSTRIFPIPAHVRAARCGCASSRRWTRWRATACRWGWTAAVGRLRLAIETSGLASAAPRVTLPRGVSGQLQGGACWRSAAIR